MAVQKLATLGGVVDFKFCCEPMAVQLKEPRIVAAAEMSSFHVKVQKKREETKRRSKDRKGREGRAEAAAGLEPGSP